MNECNIRNNQKKMIKITHRRTYKEAVDIMVDWWVEKSFNTALNQNNGDSSHDSGFGFALMNILSLDVQEDINNEKIDRFKLKLKELLMSVEGKGRFQNQLEVDYDVTGFLLEACQFAEINTNCIPIKTFTFINDNNEIEGKYQYQGKWFII